MGGQTDRQTDRETDRETDRQTERQTNRERDRQTEGQTDRQTGSGGADGIINRDDLLPTFLMGAGIGSENPKKGRARLTKPFL